MIAGIRYLSYIKVLVHCSLNYLSTAIVKENQDLLIVWMAAFVKHYTTMEEWNERNTSNRPSTQPSTSERFRHIMLKYITQFKMLKN